MKEELFLFEKELIFLNDKSRSSDMLFRKIGDMLEERGYVEKTFTEAVQAREREYPTGLRTFPFSIAIPHADSVYTKREAVVVVRPEQPIHFREMATVDQYVDAELIFLLLLKKDNAHAEFLEVLLEMTQQEEFMIGIMQAQDAKEAFGLLEKYFNAH